MTIAYDRRPSDPIIHARDLAWNQKEAAERLRCFSRGQVQRGVPPHCGILRWFSGVVTGSISAPNCKTCLLKYSGGSARMNSWISPPDIFAAFAFPSLALGVFSSQRAGASGDDVPYYPVSRISPRSPFCCWSSFFHAVETLVSFWLALAHWSFIIHPFILGPQL